MAQLDKFKRRLIRSVARLRVDEKKPENEVWEILSKEMGCDCGPLWDRMRALTMKKLGRLLACEDRTDVIANVARPSDTDMLMFDLVLAHEDDVDVIGRDVILGKATDCKALEELFELVQEFSLEETPANTLADTWADALRYYESKGNRLVSPMLLQRRWYQLKELTRANFYKLWQTYRGNTQLWDKARTDCSLTDLQVAVAERYPYVITKEFLKWDQLIKAGLVVLPHCFTGTTPEKSDSGASGNEHDLVLVEPEVETIDLRVESDSETERDCHPRDDTVQSKHKEVLKQTNEGKTATTVEYNPNITIKTEPLDSDGLSNVKILEATHIPEEPLDNTRQDTVKTEDIDPRIALKNDLLRNISKCIESTDELIKQCDPQEDQCENVQNALNDVENQMENIIKPRSSVAVTEDEIEPQLRRHTIDEDIQCKAVDYFRNKIVEEMSKASNDDGTETTVQERGTTEGDLTNLNVEDKTENSLSPKIFNTAHDVRSSGEEEEEVLEDIIKQTADDFVNKSKQSRAELEAMALTELTIVDDGIDFVDDGIEYNEDDEEKKMNIDEKQDDVTPSIDLKLLMTPVIVTTRLDDMLAFKNREFASVIGRSTIDFAELESKPKQAVKEPVKELEVQQENKSDADDLDSDASDSEIDIISDDQRVKPNSYLLQKPRSRSYNPIQLCKNPDFNTRLKRLTFGFLSSERNRQFLSACKPATVDLHKAFEDKLVSGTLYLKRSERTDLIKESSVQKDDQSVRTVSVVPSAMSVQSLIDKSKMNFQPPSTASSIDLTSDEVTERNKVIYLPDITQVRRINQNLLTAEVPPIRVQNNVTSAVPSFFEGQPAVENRVATTQRDKEAAGIGEKADDYNKTCQVIDTNKSPLLSNLLVTHKPLSFPKSSGNKNDHLLVEESSPTLEVDTTQKVLDKRIGRPPKKPDKHAANLDKPPRKPPTKTFWPYLSWNKPVVNNKLPLDDFLITHDTLLKMLAKAKNVSEFTYSTGNKNTINVYKNSQKGVKSTKGTKIKQKVSDNQKSGQEETKNIEVIKVQKDTQSEKVTKTKPRVRARKGIMKTICCWARAWVFKSKGQLLRLPKHMCPFPECNCCCKDELPRSKSKKIVENKDPIELSDDESVNDLTSVSKIIECVVQQSVEVPVPKLRVFSTDKHNQNLNKEATNIFCGSTDAQENTPRDNIVVESVCEYSKIESSVVDNTLQDVVIDDDSIPVADVQGEVSIVADDTVQNKSVNVETPMEKPRRIYIIPEASVAQMNANNPISYVKPTLQVVSTANQKISTQNHLDLNRPTPPLISSSVSKKMYVKAVYPKPSQKPPSVSMSTQTMDVPLLQNLAIDPKVKSIKTPDVIHQKQLVVDGTRPFTTPTTLVNKKEQVIHLKASKVSSDNPIFLGKNKILLTTVKFPSNVEFSKNERKDNTVAPKVVPSFPLPEGVEIILQPNGELACMVKPGVELDSTQISTLPSILEAVKQQINIERPCVIGDVINLCDDENEQINENISQVNQENALTSFVEQTQKVETSRGEHLIDDSEKTQTNQTENCQETVIEAELLTKQKHVVPESHKKETNICQVQDGDFLKSQICDDNLATEKRDQDKPCIEKESTMIQAENNKYEENKSMDNINSSTKTEVEKKETQENKEHLAGSRNLLSDLMEMSGISEEDMKTASEASTPTLPAVINIDPVNIASEMNADGSIVNQFPDLTPVTSIAQLKYACEQDGKFFKLDFGTGTLVPISVCIKKKGSTAHKLPSDTVEFAVKETWSGDKVGIPFNTKVGISVNPNTGIPAPSTTCAEGKKSILVRRFGRNKKTPVFSKPITILRHTRPQSLLRNHNQLQNKTRAFKRPRKETGDRIEAKIDLVDSDAPMEEEYLINSESDDDDMASTSKIPRDRIAYRRLAASNTITEISDDSSDDEPLAEKSKRMRSEVSDPGQAVAETVENFNEQHEKNVQKFLGNRVQNLIIENVETEVRLPETELTDADSMELDTDIPTAAILEEPMPEPEEGDSFGSESSPEDSILGM